MNRTIALRISALTLALTSLAGCASTTDVRPSVAHSSEAGDEAAAWAAWDKADGPRKLRVDPSRPYRVVYVGSGITYPSLTEYDLALPAIDGKWYVFRAEYTG